MDLLSQDSSVCPGVIIDVGATLIRAARYKEAIAVFSGGLHRVRQQIACFETSQSNDACSLVRSRADQCCCKGIACTPFLANGPTLTGTKTKGNVVTRDSCFDGIAAKGVELDADGSEEEGDQTFIFMDPVVADANNCCSSMSLETLSFMMIFNLALSHDLHSRHSDQPVVANKAQTSLKFYNIANKLQLNREVRVPTVYVCGLLNNMANLFTRLDNREEAQRCLKCLLSILMHKVSKRRTILGRTSRDVANNWEDRYYSDFFRSVSSIILKEPATAKAA